MIIFDLVFHNAQTTGPIAGRVVSRKECILGLFLCVFFECVILTTEQGRCSLFKVEGDAQVVSRRYGH